MVKSLSPSDDAFLHGALHQASQKTSAKISFVVRSRSSAYQEYALAFGLIIGSLTAFVLWYLNISSSFAELLSVQLGFIAICDMAQLYGGLFTPLVPKKIQHHYASEQALREYHLRQSAISVGEPFVLLFVSLAERYVRIITNPTVHSRMPSDWHKITQLFTSSFDEKNLRTVSSEAIGQIADKLGAFFPIKEAAKF